MSKLYLGFDTSAYTTSIGVVDGYNNILLDIRKTLEVGENKKGLRQQEALFQHVNNMPELFSILTQKIDVNKIHTISVSSKPRNTTSSYMPVFNVGKNQGFILSKVLNCNYKEFSHQEGHIGAGLLDYDFESEFLSLHISGGTSEILKVTNSKENLNISIMGGSLDLSFGQLIDRIGLHLGLSFPCGSSLDQLSKRGKIIDIHIPISIKDGLWCNLSGLENFFIHLINCNKYSKEDIAITLFHTLSVILTRLVNNTIANTKLKSILITGGVSANLYIRESLISNIDSNIYFPKQELSTDNGIGVAHLGKSKLGHGEVL